MTIDELIKWRDRNIEAEVELKKWDRYAARAKIRMRRLVKTHDASWFNGSTSSIPPSNLDHVYAADHLKFRNFKRPSDGGDAQVTDAGGGQIETRRRAQAAGANHQHARRAQLLLPFDADFRQ